MTKSAKLALGPHEPVTRSVPLASWIGGKRLLARRLCALIAATPHAAYCEPFVGMGGVFLRRKCAPRVEVINDLSGDVVNLFRVVQRWPQLLHGELDWWPAMRAEFYRIKTSGDEGLLDIERAAKFLYLQTLAFGGKVVDRTLGTSPLQPRNFDRRRIWSRVERLHNRLAGVIIENLDWAAVIDRYDRPSTLFYLDPPYWENECDYGPGMFCRADFQRLANRLRTISGHFILSVSDRPEIRSMFAWASITGVSTSYSLNKKARKEVTELIITGGAGSACVQRTKISEPHIPTQRAAVSLSRRTLNQSRIVATKGPLGGCALCAMRIMP